MKSTTWHSQTSHFSLKNLTEFTQHKNLRSMFSIWAFQYHTIISYFTLQLSSNCKINTALIIQLWLYCAQTISYSKLVSYFIQNKQQWRWGQANRKTSTRDIKQWNISRTERSIQNPASKFCKGNPSHSTLIHCIKVEDTNSVGYYKYVTIKENHNGVIIIFTWNSSAFSM